MARRTKKVIIREQMAADSKAKTPVKIQKKRVPMTEAQREAAGARLAKAREAKLEAQGGPKNVHPDVLALADDNPLSLKHVKEWIKTQKDMIPSARADVRANVKGAISRLAAHEGYVRNLERYIREGVYCDLFTGPQQQTKARLYSAVPAYDKHGNIKRSGGVYYPDIRAIYLGPGRVERDGKIELVDNV